MVIEVVSRDEGYGDGCEVSIAGGDEQVVVNSLSIKVINGVQPADEEEI